MRPKTVLGTGCCFRDKWCIKTTHWITVVTVPSNGVCSYCMLVRMKEDIVESEAWISRIDNGFVLPELPTINFKVTTFI